MSGSEKDKIYDALDVVVREMQALGKRMEKLCDSVDNLSTDVSELRAELSNFEMRDLFDEE